MAGKIRNIKSLESEISQLQAKAKILENKLDDNLDYLHDNYSSMIMGSLFHKNGLKSSFTASVAGILLGNEKLQEALSGILNTLADRASDAIENLTDRLAKKKRD